MQRSSNPAGPNTSCIEGLPWGTATLSVFFCGAGRACWGTVPRRPKAGEAWLFARSASETCVLPPRSRASSTLLSVATLRSRATRFITPVEAEISDARANSYHSIPVHPQTGTWPVDQGVPCHPDLILEHVNAFAAPSSSKVALQSMRVVPSIL